MNTVITNSEKIKLSETYCNITNDCLVEMFQKAEIGTLVAFTSKEDECGNPDCDYKCNPSQSVKTTLSDFGDFQIFMIEVTNYLCRKIPSL